MAKNQAKCNRKPLSKRTRFEVFKRDGFRCCYCGASAKTSQLEVDHIIPVSLGGSNDMDNLITSCRNCNGGKSNIELDSPEHCPEHADEALYTLEYLRRWTIEFALQDAAHLLQRAYYYFGRNAFQYARHLCLEYRSYVPIHNEIQAEIRKAEYKESLNRKAVLNEL